MQMLGLMNVLRTGDPTTDTIIAMLLPVILTQVVNQLSSRDRNGGDHETWWSRLNFLSKRLYKRTISHTDRSPNANVNRSGTLDEDSYNSFLIKAIKLYIHNHVEFDPADLDLELTDVLGSNQKGPTTVSEVPHHIGRKIRLQQQLLNTNNDNNSSSTSTFSMLQNCSIIKKPTHNKWHKLGSFDGKPVHLWISESVKGDNSTKQRNIDDSEDDGPSHSIELRLKSEGPTSVDTFVQTAYDWYMSELEKDQSDERFFFDLKGFEGRGSHRYPVFGKYTLSDEKTFKSLFSRKCHNVVELIDHFQSKSGKYSIPGYPHKLGMLLYGPPGTGKTTLIKTTAHHTKRHIVNVPLSRIETNSELMTLFFNQRYPVAGQASNASPKMDFDQVIFVFEDIDASIDIVKRREDCTDQDVPSSRPSPGFPSGRDHVEVDPFSPRAAPMHNAFGSRASNDRTNKDYNRSTPFRVEEDRLSLMGMLNVLDGVVDTPGRMIIMTSNHPEVLDPALIRPGRIDKKLELSYMESPDVVAMLEHYYQTELSSLNRERVHRAVDGSCETSKPLELIPAKVEQLAMEEETIDAMLAWLESERRALDTNQTKKAMIRPKESARDGRDRRALL